MYIYKIIKTNFIKIFAKNKSNEFTIITMLSRKSGPTECKPIILFTNLHINNINIIILFVRSCDKTSDPPLPPDFVGFLPSSKRVT